MTTLTATTFRTHLSLNARDIERSIAFYTTLFGPPTKTRPDYAKWDLEDPGLVLAVNAAPGLPPTGSSTLSHLGLRVADDVTLQREHARLTRAGVPILLEETGVTCCYAVQNKFWVHDPDGNAWEVYHFLEDADAKGEGNQGQVQDTRTGGDVCCPTTDGGSGCC